MNSKSKFFSPLNDIFGGQVCDETDHDESHDQTEKEHNFADPDNGVCFMGIGSHTIY